MAIEEEDDGVAAGGATGPHPSPVGAYAASRGGSAVITLSAASPQVPPPLLSAWSMRETPRSHRTKKKDGRSFLLGYNNRIRGVTVCPNHSKGCEWSTSHKNPSIIVSETSWHLIHTCKHATSGAVADIAGGGGGEDAPAAGVSVADDLKIA
jgi:hypothetical protein